MAIPRIKISSLKLRGAPAIDLQDDELVLITGPNNSGKSQILREIRSHIAADKSSSVLIEDMGIERLYTADDLSSYIEQNFAKSINRSNGIVSLESGGFLLSQVASMSRGNSGKLAGLVDVFVYHAETRTRLTEVDSPPQIDRTSTTPQHPIQRMAHSDELELEISARFRKAFGKDLIPHKSAGTVIPLYVGDPPGWTKQKDRTSDEYISKLESLPRLDAQGDGMKAFAGIMLRMLTFDRSILLIDEPEAFLHPPQARLLGRMIASERPANVQVFVATHSRDIIQGIMEARPPTLRLGRITRSANSGSVHWLDPQKAEQFVTDPLLRTSGALDGLFHDKTFLCEGDRDAVFYRELERNGSAKKVADSLFLNTGGKDRMPDFLEALQSLGIYPSVISDIDLIRSEGTLSKMVRAKDGDTAKISALASRVVAAVAHSGVPRSADSIRAKIDAVFSGLQHSQKPMPKDAVREVRAILDEVDPFVAVKRAGWRAIPGAQAQKEYRELSEALEKLSIWLVPEGELEGFLRTGGRKGREWLASALGRNIDTDPDLVSAREFAGRVFQ